MKRTSSLSAALLVVACGGLVISAQQTPSVTNAPAQDASGQPAPEKGAGSDAKPDDVASEPGGGKIWEESNGFWLEHAQAEPLVPILRQLFSTATITADPERNGISITGSREDVSKAWEVVKKFDRAHADRPTRPSPNGGRPVGGAPKISESGESTDELTVFYLKHTKAQSVSAILSQLFRDFTPIVDQRLNAIIVRSDSKEDLDKLEAVLKLLDQRIGPDQAQQPNQTDRARKPTPEDIMRALRGGSRPSAPRQHAVVPRQPSPEDFLRALRGGAGASARQQSATLREKYNELEQQAARTAEQYRDLPDKATRERFTAAALKRQLADTVKRAFEARQDLQRAELAAFCQRLVRIERQIATRERIKDEIIDRRIEDLLNPEFRWDGNQESASRTSASANVTQSQILHAMTQTGDYTPAASKTVAQILFCTPQGARVTLPPDRADATTIELPARVNILKSLSDGPVPFRLSNIPAHAGLELSGTIELTPIGEHTRAFLQHNVIPVEIHNGDVDQASSGNLVTKVIYVPKPEHQELALAGVETIVSTRLDPGLNPITEADRRGYVLATVRLGNRVADDPESSEAKRQPGAAGHEQTSSVTDSRLEEIRHLETQLATLRQTYGAQHPRLREIESQLESLRGRRSAENLPSSPLILRSADEYGRKLNQAESELKQVLQWQEEDLADADSVQFHRRQLAAIREEHAAQMRLLELNLKEAELAVESATELRDNKKKLYENGVITQSGMIEAQRGFDAAILDVERAKTLLELYRKVGWAERPQSESVDEEARADSPTAEPQPAPNASSATKATSNASRIANMFAEARGDLGDIAPGAKVQHRLVVVNPYVEDVRIASISPTVSPSKRISVPQVTKSLLKTSEKGEIVVEVDAGQDVGVYTESLTVAFHEPFDAEFALPLTWTVRELDRIEEKLELDGAVDNFIWDMLGVKLRPLSQDALPNKSFRGGMQIIEVRKHGAAAEAKLQVDDVIVGMHHWETISLNNVVYVLEHEYSDLQPNQYQSYEVKFWVLRGDETLSTTMRLRIQASATD